MQLTCLNIGLDTGGALWFTNLCAAPDPFALRCACCALCAVRCTLALRGVSEDCSRGERGCEGCDITSPTEQRMGRCQPDAYFALPLAHAAVVAYNLREIPNPLVRRVLQACARA